MYLKLRCSPRCIATSARALAALLVVAAPQVRSGNQLNSAQSDPDWHKMSVQLPASTATFPAGAGADIANAECLICHSAGMVLRQPALTSSQWRITINKMRTAYGAPLAAERVDALAEYLSTLTPNEGSGTGAANLAAAGAGTGGAGVFLAHCVACHQASGAGLPGAFPPLAGSNWVNGPDTTLVEILLHGVQGKLTVNGIAYNGTMPAFGSQLSDAEIAAVLSYVRSQWNNRSGPIGADLVRSERARTPARSDPWNGDAELTTR